VQQLGDKIAGAGAVAKLLPKKEQLQKVMSDFRLPKL
jgi:hypothetical protein